MDPERIQLLSYYASVFEREYLDRLSNAFQMLDQVQCLTLGAAHVSKGSNNDKQVRLAGRLRQR